jgi:hypothetical protein
MELPEVDPVSSGVFGLRHTGIGSGGGTLTRGIADQMGLLNDD